MNPRTRRLRRIRRQTRRRTREALVRAIRYFGSREKLDAVTAAMSNWNGQITITRLPPRGGPLVDDA